MAALQGGYLYATWSLYWDVFVSSDAKANDAHCHKEFVIKVNRTLKRHNNSKNTLIPSWTTVCRTVAGCIKGDISVDGVTVTLSANSRLPKVREKNNNAGAFFFARSHSSQGTSTRWRGYDEHLGCRHMSRASSREEPAITADVYSGACFPAFTPYMGDSSRRW